MVWLQPAALLGLLAIAGPLVVHLLRRQPARRLVVPTIRFVAAHAHSSMRLRLPADPLLLLVRVLVVATAAAALAAPLITAPRRAVWDGRMARAVIVDTNAREGVRPDDIAAATGRPHTSRVFESAGLPDALRRAAAWLAQAPPARREVIILSDFRHGALRGAELAVVPPHIGVRFVSTARSTPVAGRLKGAAILSEGREWVPYVAGTTQGTGVEFEAADSPASLVDVLGEPLGTRERDPWRLLATAGVLAPDPARPVRVRLGARPEQMDAATITPWHVRAGQAVLLDRRIHPMSVHVTSDTKGLIVTHQTKEDSLQAAAIVAAALDSVHDPAAYSTAESVLIPDEDLQAWSRVPGPADPSAWQHADTHDGRWLWAGVLALLTVEWWIRRRHPRGAEAIHADAA